MLATKSSSILLLGIFVFPLVLFWKFGGITPPRHVLAGDNLLMGRSICPIGTGWKMEKLVRQHEQYS